MLCTGCNKDLPVENFTRQASNPRGYKHRCRACTNKYRRKYYDPRTKHKEKQREYARHRDKYVQRANERNRKLRERSLGGAWNDQIADIYEQARNMSQATGVQYDVDHVIPLVHTYVCGLHVPWNMTVITHTENMRKSNNFTLWWGQGDTDESNID